MIRLPPWWPWYGRLHLAACCPGLAPAPPGVHHRTRSITRNGRARRDADVRRDWVHACYTGRARWEERPSWHPPRDPRYGCAFGHEHGSNPRAFATSSARGCRRSGTSVPTGSEEAHAGFKVFVVNRDRKGLAWMVVLHQGSGSRGAEPCASTPRNLAVQAQGPPADRPHAPHGGLRRCSRTALPRSCGRTCGCCRARPASPSMRNGTPP